MLVSVQWTMDDNVNPVFNREEMKSGGNDVGCLFNTFIYNPQNNGEQKNKQLLNNNSCWDYVMCGTNEVW